MPTNFDEIIMTIQFHNLTWNKKLWKIFKSAPLKQVYNFSKAPAGTSTITVFTSSLEASLFN